MRPHATIYKTGFAKLHGETVIHLPPRIRFMYRFMRLLGAGILASAICGILFSYGPIIKEEIRYDMTASSIQETKAQENTFPIDSSFSISIPKIGAHANILANVDTKNSLEYMDALKNGVAHAKGTAFPGEGKRIFLFAHSTDLSINIAKYNAVFYLLRKLEKDDRISIHFEGKDYTYFVFETKVVDAMDTSFLESPETGEVLVLMTCTPPGTTWMRLLVFARPQS